MLRILSMLAVAWLLTAAGPTPAEAQPRPLRGTCEAVRWPGVPRCPKYHLPFCLKSVSCINWRRERTSVCVDYRCRRVFSR